MSAIELILCASDSISQPELHLPPENGALQSPSSAPPTSLYVMSLQNEIDEQNRLLKEFPSDAEGTIGTRYRFRAECQRDADLFLHAILFFIEPSWKMSPISYYPDIDVTFSISREISPRDLLWIACSIVDGHVLVQTLEKEGAYTGERDYERDIDVHASEFKPSAAVLADMKKGASLYVKRLKFLLTDAKEFAANLKVITN